MLDAGIKGKLAVYFFPEPSSTPTSSAMRSTIGWKRTSRSHSDARSNEPYIAVTVLPGQKPIDLEVEASGQVGVALLQAKAGPAALPSWMKDGFAKALLMRGDPRSFATDRATVKKLLYDTKVKPSKYKAADIWAPGSDMEKRLISASLTEYLAFGPDSGKLGKILGGLRADENGANPTFEAALKSADMTPDALDKAWKKWADGNRIVSRLVGNPNGRCFIPSTRVISHIKPPRPGERSRFDWAPPALEK